MQYANCRSVYLIHAIKFENSIIAIKYIIEKFRLLEYSAACKEHVHAIFTVF